jgi:hypothetical protein
MIKWIKDNSLFRKLNLDNQVSCNNLLNSLNYIYFVFIKARLLEKNWKDLFIIFLAQWNIPIHLLSENDEPILFENFLVFKQIYTNLLKLSLDFNEYDYFKMIILLKNGNINHLIT